MPSYLLSFMMIGDGPDPISDGITWWGSRIDQALLDVPADASRSRIVVLH